MENYKVTLSLTGAMEESKRLADMRQRKAEASRVSAEMKPTPQSVDRPAQSFQPERTWLGFKAHLTVEDAKALREFFESRHIKFFSI